jgi:uncharacterized membrane protein
MKPPYPKTSFALPRLSWSLPRLPAGLPKLPFPLPKLNVPTLATLHGVVTLLVFAAVTHICIVLLMPYLSYGNAWSRLEQFVPINRLAVLEGSDTGTPPLPFMAPDVRYAACRYDLTGGPLELHTQLPSELWSIALYNRYGENYYLLNGQDVQGRAVNMLVVKDSASDEEKKEEIGDQNTATREVHEVTVSAPAASGIILIRAPVPNGSYAAEVAAQLASAYCKPIDFGQLATNRKRMEPVAPAATQQPAATKNKRRGRRQRQQPPQ